MNAGGLLLLFNYYWVTIDKLQPNQKSRHKHTREFLPKSLLILNFSVLNNILHLPNHHIPTKSVFPCLECVK